MAGTLETPQARRLCSQLAQFLAPHSVLVGIGNRARGDDGFGPAVVEAVRQRTTLRVVDAGTVPENFVPQIAAWRPASVLFVDAAEMSRAPGELALLAPEQLTSAGVGTHGTSPAVLADYLKLASGAPVRFLLAQPSRRPARVGLATSLRPEPATGRAEQRTYRMSRPMRGAVAQAGGIILTALHEPRSPEVASV